jgi:hypothetical protein
MTGQLSHITRCMDLGEADIVQAIVERGHTKALLTHLATISAPNTGVAKVLLVLARMATTACDWIDGDLAIEMVEVEGETRVDVATELGGGLRERVLPPLVFHVPLAEFTRAIERVAHMVAPLRIGAKTPRRITFLASAVARRTSVPPPPIEIAPESLFFRPEPPLAVQERDDEGPPGSLPVVLAAAPAAKSLMPGSPTEPPLGELDSGGDD